MEILNNFAVLEGGDGSGTSTQLSMLTERFNTLKKPAFFPTFEPTESQIGQIIRRGLKGEIPLKPETICLLFAADRNEHLFGDDGILAHTKRGCLAVSDRYALSSLVYQGIECGDELPQFINSRFPAPELTIFLDIEPETAISRMKSRGSLDIYERLDFQKKVREKYMSVLEAYHAAGAKALIIDASKNAREVAEEIWSIISKMPIFNI